MTSTAHFTPADTEHFDVIVVGAGLSGIGAARLLQQHNPDKSFVILESRDAIGGTWDLFRYPGVRSDSDMFTLSYPFRPWRERKAIADGASIRRYIEDTAAEGALETRIRYRTKVLAANWDSARARWTITAQVGAEAAEQTFTCSFLYMCTGYYNYEHGYQPDFPGVADFAGRMVHPQFWPEDLDYAGKRVVVIGSGATAATLVPAMAEQAGHVRMLQRSPTYYTALPSIDKVADVLRRYLPAGVAHSLARTKNVVLSQAFYQLCRRHPELAKKLLRAGVLRFLRDESYVDEHFTPAYQPWDQRLCVVPEGDLFESIQAGTASVVTGHIERFVPTGIRLTSGEVLEADIVVSATGLSLLPFGGLEMTVDGKQVELGKTMTYRGLMISGVPNFACCIGYTNASWTLRADLSSRYVCRLLTYLDQHGLAAATPRAPAMTGTRPLLDLTSGYIKRSIARFPAQGDRTPWRVRQNYLLDRFSMARPNMTRDMDFTAKSGIRSQTVEEIAR